MREFDVRDIREYLLAYFPKADFDKNYTFYYDETNNLKKFYVREADFNASFSSNFILGGLCFEKTPTDLLDLFSGLKLQNNITDVKLKHLARGEFLDCVKSQKLNYFLEYLLDKRIITHFHWVNLLYWSVADIVDSCIMNSEIAMKVGRMMGDKVKDDFYKFAKAEIGAIIDLFYKYQYPNIKPESVVEFIEELEEMFYPYIAYEEYHFGLESLRQILDDTREKKVLPLLRGEEDHILIKDFAQFYIDPIGLFKNSVHIFDNEATVCEALKNIKIVDGDREIKNYSFVDSKTNPIIQASDIYVGIMGKFSNFLNTNDPEEIVRKIEASDPLQQRNIDLLMLLMSYSDSVNPAFIHSIDSNEEKDKTSLICAFRGL